MSDQERAILVAFVGANPEAGEIMPETGGVRKLRWALEGRGKRGDARVIYYYHSERVPLFLLSAFPKNEKANLSRAERNAMKQLNSEKDIRGFNRNRDGPKAENGWRECHSGTERSDLLDARRERRRTGD